MKIKTKSIINRKQNQQLGIEHGSPGDKFTSLTLRHGNSSFRILEPKSQEKKLHILHSLKRLYRKKNRKICKDKKVEKNNTLCFFPVTTGSYGGRFYLHKNTVGIDPL